MLLLEAGLGGRGNGLGDERGAGGILELTATAGRVGNGLVELHRHGCSNIRLKSGEEGTTAGEFVCDNLFQLLHEFKD